MSDKFCDHHDDAAGWVLGALSDEEAERFEAHLGACPSCQAELARLGEAAELLLEGVPLVAPRPELRDRLLGAVREEAGRPGPASPDSVAAEPARQRPRLLRRLRLGTGVLLAVAVGVIAAAVLVWGGSGAPTDTRTVPGQVTSAGGAPRARAAVRIRPRQASLELTDLAAPPPGQVYQAWVVPLGSPAVPTGALFSVPVSGETRIQLPSLRRVAEVIMTAEPPGGSLTPTLPAVVVVDLQRARP